MVLATGFVHVLPDANSALSNPCLGLTIDYPVAFTLAAFAAMLTLAIEVAIGAVLRAGLTPRGLDAEHAVSSFSLPLVTRVTAIIAMPAVILKALTSPAVMVKAMACCMHMCTYSALDSSVEL